jgi:DNA-binding LytR/AlgR family response regulator
MMNIAIIEDEPLMAEELERMVLSLQPDWTVVAKLDSIKQALAYFEQNEFPDLFLSDIQLTDGLSFEFFKAVNTSIPVIFCTAYNQYALEAFRANGVDYILKPFDREIIGQTLDKFQKLFAKKTFPTTALEQFIQHYSQTPKSSLKNIIVYQGEKMIPIQLADLFIASLENGMCFIYTRDGKRYISNKSLDTLEQKLGGDFFRANRQCLIHREAVKTVVPYFARKLLIQPSILFESNIVVSKAKASRFLRWLESGGEL